MGKLFTFDEFLKAAGNLSKLNTDFGCVMMELHVDGWADILSKIDKADLQEDKKGLETEPHVTVLYGIHDWDEPADKIKSIVMGFKPPKVSLAGITLFQNEKFDVVKIDVESEDLAAMNKKLTNDLMCTVTYPEYHAHATIAYVKPGTGKKYEGMSVTIPKDQIVLKKVLYSTSDKSKIKFDLNDE